MNEEIKRNECLRCGHAWKPRKAIVKYCPLCKSPYWNKERTRYKNVI